MGELSQRIGKKLERYGESLFVNFGWKTLAQDLEIECTRAFHKSKGAKGGKKVTHGIDGLYGFYNPFTARNEAVLVECKNRQWSEFIPSNINQWIEELTNTIECSSSSVTVSPYIKDHVLTTGILLYNSSDNKYDPVRAIDVLSKISVPKRKHPIMLFLADTNRLEKWNALVEEILKIQSGCQDHNFSIIYPSIGGSNWAKVPTIIPSYLFSDFVLSTFTTIQKASEDDMKRVEVKSIFCFDKVCDESMRYLLDMVNELQLEAHEGKYLEIQIYFYPESTADIALINDCFGSVIGKNKPSFVVKLLKNRQISPVDHE